MNRITYVKAEMKNLNEIIEVYKKGILVMEAQGIHQWDEIYPSLDDLKDDVEKNELTVGRLDAFSQNPFSLRMYAKLGYEITGEANWRKGLFYLMEKLI